MGFLDWIKRQVKTGAKWVNNKIINPTINTARKLAHSAKKFVHRTLPSWVNQGKDFL